MFYYTPYPARWYMISLTSHCHCCLKITLWCQSIIGVFAIENSFKGEQQIKATHIKFIFVSKLFPSKDCASRIFPSGPVATVRIPAAEDLGSVSGQSTRSCSQIKIPHATVTIKGPECPKTPRDSQIINQKKTMYPKQIPQEQFNTHSSRYGRFDWNNDTLTGGRGERPLCSLNEEMYE